MLVAVATAIRKVRISVLPANARQRIQRMSLSVLKLSAHEVAIFEAMEFWLPTQWRFARSRLVTFQRAAIRFPVDHLLDDSLLAACVGDDA